jgi:hypothetical protein
MGEQLECAVTDCDSPAIARVFPTHGETEHSALRCRDCLEFDLRREWFRQWADAIRDPNRGDA